jgi:transcriptional regulator with XRE-family HTH domain
MGISTSTISNLARKKYNPSISTLKAIAEWANRPLTTILELAGYIEPPQYEDKSFHALMERVTQLDDAGLLYLIEQADFWLWSVQRIRRRKKLEKLRAEER